MPEDYTAFLKADGLQGLRVGINRGYEDEFSDEQRAICEAAYAAMTTAGATVVEGLRCPIYAAMPL